MKLNTTLILLFLMVFYIIIPTILTFLKNSKVKKILDITYSVLFFIMLFVGVFGKIDINKTFTTIFFDFTNEMFSKQFNFKFWIVNFQDFIINISMLFPLGYIFTSFIKSKKVVLISFVLGLLTGMIIEISQFLLPIYRSPQLSDIILNGVSALIGAIYFYLIRKLALKNIKN